MTRKWKARFGHRANLAVSGSAGQTLEQASASRSPAQKMTKAVVSAIPTLFTLQKDGYSRFVVVGGAEQMMRDTWRGVGARMADAISQVGTELKIDTAKTKHGSAPTPKTKHYVHR